MGACCLVIFTTFSEARAGFFDFVTDIFASEIEAEEKPVHNSQNIPLLTAVTNSEPHIDTTPLNIVDESVIEAAVGPMGTPLEIEQKDIPDKISLYIVRQGDTLASVAKMFGVTPNTVSWANNGKKVLKLGEELVILPISGLKYTVQKGDTLSSIATKFKADKDEIVQFNDIIGAISVGQEIIIPDGTLTTTSATKPTTGGGSSVSTPTGLSGYFIRPTSGRMTQGPHGPRRSAVDIANKVGTAIYAAANGKVIVARSGGYNGGYGSYIVIEHANGLQTLYAHLSGIQVSAGQKVSGGDVIGAMGSTGKSTGSHLHFEVKGGKYGWNPVAK